MVASRRASAAVARANMRMASEEPEDEDLSEGEAGPERAASDDEVNGI